MDACHECCVLSGRGLCDEMITYPGESYGLWCIIVCDLLTSWMRRPWPTGGLSRQKQTKVCTTYCDFYICGLWTGRRQWLWPFSRKVGHPWDTVILNKLFYNVYRQEPIKCT